MDIFHQIALEEYLIALLDDKHNDSDYVKQKVYERYELEKRSDNR